MGEGDIGNMPAQKKYATAAQRQAAYRRRCAAQREVELASKGMPALPRVPSMPGHKRWDAMRTQALCLVEQIASEMETYHDERSEEWQDSQRGDSFTELIESVEEIADALRELQQQ